MQTAAFFRLEGPLVRRPALAAAAWLAANAQHATTRAARVGAVALAAPFFAGPLRDRAVAAKLGWAALRGMSEDRLAVLGELYAEQHLVPHADAVGRRLLDDARARGHRVVVVSDGIDHVVEPAARELGADDVLCNRLELRDGRATGRLAEPVLASFGAAALRRFADDHDVDLTRSAGYGATVEDGLLLAAVGPPCAVRPDRGLRALARDHDWPIVEDP